MHRSRGLAEAREVVQTIPDANTVANELDQKLVHLSGFADTEETLVDDKFFVRENALHLARRAEMYQWVEKEKSKGENNQKEYTYSYAWVNEPVDSSRFRRPAGHENPNMPVRGMKVSAKEVQVGAYKLDNDLRDQVDNWTSIEVPEETIKENLSEEERDSYVFRNNELFIGAEGAPSPEAPKVGDLRIQFEAVMPTDVSFVAQLRGETFGEFRTSNGEAIHDLYLGTLSAEDVMQRLETENTVLAWGLRMLGLAICVGGFAMCLKPLSAVVSFIPFAESLTGALTFVVALLLGGMVSLVVVGISWIAVRPLFGISLLAIAGVAVYLVSRINRKQKDEIVDATVMS
ncbi:MAG: hypothetical protein Aurels2KO_05640 [Aureliella sp.]